MSICKKTILWIFVVLTIAGCSVFSSRTPTLYPADSPNSLLNTYWNLVLLKGQPLAKGTSIVLFFSDKNINGAPEDTIFGHAGCNWYRGPYHANSQQIRLENFQLTVMECVGNTGVMAQEETYTDLLNSAIVYKIADYQINTTGGHSKLEILDGNGQPVLVYEAITQDSYQTLYNSPPLPQNTSTARPTFAPNSKPTPPS